jgi:hypothetical protein
MKHKSWATFLEEPDGFELHYVEMIGSVPCLGSQCAYCQDPNAKVRARFVRFYAAGIVLAQALAIETYYRFDPTRQQLKRAILELPAAALEKMPAELTGLAFEVRRYGDNYVKWVECEDRINGAALFDKLPSLARIWSVDLSLLKAPVETDTPTVQFRKQA